MALRAFSIFGLQLIDIQTLNTLDKTLFKGSVVYIFATYIHEFKSFHMHVAEAGM